MRDEVLAEWETNKRIALHVHCHVSGGLVIGLSKWRDSIFRHICDGSGGILARRQETIDIHPK